MGNQGASGDGVRQLVDWYKAGIIGDVTEVWVYTDRPVWPQGVPWSNRDSHRTQGTRLGSMAGHCTTQGVCR